MTKLERYIVYKATSPSGKSYIGVTGRTLKERKKDHKAASRKGKNNPFHNALRLYGENIVWDILISYEDPQEAYLKEQELIANLDTLVPNGYNATLGGEYAVGYKLPPRSDSHKKKLSEKAKLRTGSKNSFYNKKHTKESKNKMSESRSGKPAHNRKKVIDQFGTLYAHPGEAAERCNMSVKSVYNCCHKLRTVKGWELRYV